MKNIIFTIIVLFGLNACTDSKSPNQLTKKEIKEGWELLFDGKSMEAWKGYCKDQIPASWTVTTDGAMHISGNSNHETDPVNGGDIVTRDIYENFELSLEWKVSEGGNSGIFYLAKEVCGYDTVPAEPMWKLAPEMQILDNKNNADAKEGKDGNHQAGSLYDLIPANPQTAKLANEWNQVKITVYKGTVIHAMNGQTVLEYRLWSKHWKDLCANSKFASFPDFINTSESGHIGLQDHGYDVWFRNIKIRKL